jgi:tetrahydromethanopterin:alpha-L-glutamate ligase
VKIGVAGIPGAWSSEQLAACLRERGADAFVFSLGDVVHDLVSGEVTWQATDLRSIAGVAVKKLGDQGDAAARLRLHALRSLESAGVRVFSRVDSIDLAMDRYRMTMILAQAGLPLPATIAAETPHAIAAAIERFGDSVLKPVFTSKGRGMVRVNAASASRAAIERGGPMLVQRFVAAPGRDIGATIVGGKFLGAFYRVARAGEWMTTTAAGGQYAACELGQRGIELAERAARAFRLDYTVVDLVEQGDDYLMYEVSAFGGFRGLLESAGVDAAGAYADHIIRSLES